MTPDGSLNITDISANGMTYSSGSFDPRNKLNQVTVSSTAYNYNTDGNDRRVFKQVGSSGTKTFYIFSGDQLIGEITGSTPSVAYSWGADGVASERLLTGTPKSLFYCYGPQGETRNLTDSSVTVVDTYLYNAYGKLRSSTGSDPNPFRYGGKFGYYTDPNTGLQLAGARWYSPNAFRWLGRDPIHYRGGDNLYSYVGGNPVMYVDPSGLEVFLLFDEPPVLTRPMLEAARPTEVIKPAPTEPIVHPSPPVELGPTADPQINPRNSCPMPPRLPGQPHESPGPGWEFRGPPDEGSWFKEPTGESLRPDDSGHGPHWDWKWRKDPYHPRGYRIFPDGRIIPKA